jgi:hypothetical protein
MSAIGPYPEAVGFGSHFHIGVPILIIYFLLAQISEIVLIVRSPEINFLCISILPFQIK